MVGDEEAVHTAQPVGRTRHERRQLVHVRLMDLFHDRSVYQLATLLVLLGLGSWLNERWEAVPVFLLLLTLVLLSSIFRLSLSRRQAWLGATLGVPAIVSLWLREFVNDIRLSEVALAFVTLFMAYTAATILIHVLTEAQITMDTLSEAFSVFLLMGFSWACVYGLLYLQAPGVFRLPDEISTVGVSGLTADVPIDVMIYFSFVTLTTVGYGDVLPVASLARGMAVLEMVVGHFYLAILIGRLVGLSTIFPGKES